jgi:photosystem II stability/assembly factor-like uncharacterized protein
MLLAVGAAVLAEGSKGALPVGVDAALSPRPVETARPERALLLGVSRAGDRLVAVGEQGLVVLSDDHGRNWRNARRVPVAATLTQVRFASAQIGWAVGHLGVVLATTDGGETWHKQLDGRAIGQLALAQASSDSARAEARALIEDGPDKPLLDIWIDDTRHITIVGAYNLALRSDDAGNSWRVISSQMDNPGRLHLYGIARIDGRLFAAGEQATLIAQAPGQPADSGLQAMKTQYDGSYFGLLPIGRYGLLVYGLRGNAFFSTNAGQSWQPAAIAGASASLNTALQLIDGRVLLGDQGGNVFVSSDDGKHFQRVPFSWGAPLTGMTQAANGKVWLSSLGGLVALPDSALPIRPVSRVPAAKP